MEKERQASERAAQEGRTIAMFAIDPLLAALAHFDTSEDLTQRIHLLFRVLDVDENHALSFDEFSVGLKKLRVHPEIRLSLHDWEVITSAVTLTEGRELRLPEFEFVMRRQLKLYVQRQLANAMEMVGNSSPDRPGTTLFVLKLLLIGVDEILLNSSPSFDPGNHTSMTSRPALDDSEGLGKGGDSTAPRARGVCDRLRALESQMQDLQENMRYLVSRQRDADDKAAAPVFNLQGPATFVRTFSDRMQQAQNLTTVFTAPTASGAFESSSHGLPPGAHSRLLSKHELPHFQAYIFERARARERERACERERARERARARDREGESEREREKHCVLSQTRHDTLAAADHSCSANWTHRSTQQGRKNCLNSKHKMSMCPDGWKYKVSAIPSQKQKARPPQPQPRNNLNMERRLFSRRLQTQPRLFSRRSRTKRQQQNNPKQHRHSQSQPAKRQVLARHKKTPSSKRPWPPQLCFQQGKAPSLWEG
jgi:hypothetical protein